MTVRGDQLGVAPISQDLVVSRLRDTLGIQLRASLAERSPVGPRAIRLDAGRPSECGALAQAIGRLEWIGGVESRPPNVYVSLSDEALLECVIAELECGLPFESHVDERRSEDPACEEELAAFRRHAVERCTSTLARAHGRRELHADSVSVGGVDVRQGPLRARYGGMVTVADLQREVEASDRPAALRLMLLRADRQRRVVIDDAYMCREAADARRLLEVAATVPAGRVWPDEIPSLCRPLAAQLDVVLHSLERAMRLSEPAILVRYAHELRTRADVIEHRLPLAMPIRDVVKRVERTLLNLTAVRSPEVLVSDQEKGSLRWA